MNPPGLNSEEGMLSALYEARQAFDLGEVPVGAAVFLGGQLLASAGNRRETLQDPTAHAEVLALRAAAQKAGSWRLSGATVYVTQEPCPMCAGALLHARVAGVVYGCANPKAGSVRTLYQLLEDPRLNHRVEVLSGVEERACAALLTSFFERLRAQGKK